MKKLLALMLALTASLMIASAQDIIVLKNSERIDAKIVNVSSTEISYKKASYLDGPTFTLNIAKVSSIIYANGDVQAFNAAPESTVAVTAASENTAAVATVAAVPKTNSDKLRFNLEPQGEKRTFGISVGYTSKQMKDKDGDKYPWCYIGDDDSKKSSAALRVGFYWAPEFRYGIGLQTGLYYDMSTSTYKEEEISLSSSEHSLSIPLRIQYRYEIIPDLSIFLYTGPSFDISLAYTAKASYMGETEKESMYGEDSDLNRFNMLWGVGAGVRWKGLQLMLGGDWGLTNIYKDDPWKTKLNKPFSISLTYLF